MEANNDLSVKEPGTKSVLTAAILITYLIAGFITACICSIGYILIK